MNNWMISYLINAINILSIIILLGMGFLYPGGYIVSKIEEKISGEERQEVFKDKYSYLIIIGILLASFLLGLLGSYLEHINKVVPR